MDLSINNIEFNDLSNIGPSNFYNNDNVQNNDEDEDIELNNIVDSFWEANSESDGTDTSISSDEENNYNKNNKKISFNKLKQQISNNFDINLIKKYSSALDVMASYIKCHINIYLDASYYCSFQLNLFMFPCIFLSSVCTVLSSVDYDNSRKLLIISIINGWIAFLLAIINYLKLDACSESHKITSYQYNKLKSYIEFTSGEILLFQDPAISNKNYIEDEMDMWKKCNKHLFTDKKKYSNAKYTKYKELNDDVLNKEKELIKIIQIKILEFKKTLKNIHEMNQFILPKKIQNLYYKIYNVNIFSYIKNIDSYRFSVLNDLRNVKNEIRFYKNTTNSNSINIVHKITNLYNRKNSLIKELSELNSAYNLLDYMFQQEIININLYKKYWYLFYLQNFINFFYKCFGIYHKDSNSFLPSQYKNPYKFGYVDSNGIYLLEKILNI